MSEIGDVVILDVDANELKTPFNDLDSLPSDLVRQCIIAFHDTSRCLVYKTTLTCKV